MHSVVEGGSESFRFSEDLKITFTRNMHCPSLPAENTAAAQDHRAAVPRLLVLPELHWDPHGLLCCTGIPLAPEAALGPQGLQWPHWWVGPRRQLSTHQPLVRSPPVGWGREVEKQKQEKTPGSTWDGLPSQRGMRLSLLM